MKKISINNIYHLLILITSLIFVESSLKFNIPSYRDKCFQQTIYLEGTLLIRYDLTGYEPYFKTEKEQQELFNSIKIFIKDEKGKNVDERSLKGKKDKYAVFLKEAQAYQVCARYYKPRRGKELPGSVLMGLKIRNDYHYTEIEHSLHKEDVNNFWKKIRNIKKDMVPSIEGAKNEIKEEDNTAKSMIRTINIYNILCCIQLAIIVATTSFTIFSYQEFFKNKSLI